MLTKFPRTPHLAALGSGVTRDDLVMDGRDAADFLAHSRLVIEEKVDGTNLGISFHGPTFQLHLQHRGGAICPGSETQYAKLQSWLDRRMAHLIEALGTRYVLYGEWLAARHSVAYSRLPDLFLAFDVLDTRTGRFMCKAERDIILKKARAWPVRCIAEGALPGGLAELTMMLLNTNSLYCDGVVPVEGLYVRQEGPSSSGSTSGVTAARAAPARIGSKAGAKTGKGAAGSSVGAGSEAAAAPQGCWLLARAKLVHPNFSQALAEGGGRHWSTRILETNTARPDLWPEEPWHEDEAIAGAEQGGEASDSSPAGAAAAAAAAQPIENVADVAAAPQQPATTGAGSSRGSGSPEGPKQRPIDRPEEPAAAGSASGNSNVGKARAGKSVYMPGTSRQQSQLCLAGGAVAVKGAAVDDVAACYQGQVPAAAVEKRRSRFGTSFHISLFSPSELPQVRSAAASSSAASLSGPGRELLQQLQELLRDDEAPSSTSANSSTGCAASCQLGSWLPLGLGRLASAPAAAYFVAVVWPAAQELRRLLGLPDKDFHITLGFDGADVHAGSKGLSSLVMPAMAAPAPDCAAVGTAGSNVATGMSGLLDSLSAQASTASQQQAECMLAAVKQCRSGGRDGSSATMHLACSTLLLAALQCVDGSVGGRSSGWEDLGVLCLAAARLLVQAGSGSSGSAHGCSSTAAAALALLARLAGRNGDLAACVHLATTAADEAIAGAAAGAGAYAQLLLGKALFQQGDAAAALAAFCEARKAIVGSAAPTMAGSGRRPEGAGAAAAAAESWLDSALLQMVDGAVLDKAIRACSAAKDPPAAAAAGDDPVPLALSDPRQKFTVKDVPQVGDVTMMRNTSWLIPGRLMGASTPTSREHIAALSHLGVRLVVTLTEEGPLPPDWFSSASTEGGKGQAGRAGAGVAGITNVLVPVTNYETPTAAQMDHIMGLVESTWAGSTAGSSSSSSSSSSPPAAVMVHCGGGKGRAGTVLACLLCKHGTTSWHDAGTSADEATKQPTMTSAEAIKWLRQQRPGSIETEQQERFVADYCSLLWQRCSWAAAFDAGLPAGASSSAGSAASAASVVHDLPVGNASGSSSSSSSITPVPHQQLPRLIICVGLPGSGKSTFAQALAAAGSGDDSSGSTGSSKWQQQRGGAWQRVCQDECGGRSAAEAAFSNAVLKGHSRVVLDRCNATAADRAEWLSLALLRSNKRGMLLSGVWAVHFDVTPETCIARVAARSDHPSIPQGRGRRAVESFAATLEPPTRAEGFERVVTVSTPQEVHELLLLLGLPPSGG